MSEKVEYYETKSDGRYIVYDDGSREEMPEDEQLERYGNVR